MPRPRREGSVVVRLSGLDGEVVVVDGAATGDLRSIPGTYTHPDGPDARLRLRTDQRCSRRDRRARPDAEGRTAVVRTAYRP